MFVLALLAFLVAFCLSRRFRRVLLILCCVLVGGFLAIQFVGNVILTTARNVAHRPGHPLSQACLDQAALHGEALTEASRRIGSDPRRNIELAAGAGRPEVEASLRCIVQTHRIFRHAWPEGARDPLTYHMAFLEYQEDGNPQALDTAPATGSSADPKPAAAPIRSQLDVLLAHLGARRSNYVLVFVHGWRHDASLGDENVANAHRYGAHAARFLAERGEAYRETEVTVVYVGWPGARVDEARMRRPFDAIGLPGVGDAVVGSAAGLTLFDRKPISERVAPFVLSALRRVAKQLDDQRKATPDTPQKLIVFGHSLGGNLLATALDDQLDRAIRAHAHGAPFPSPLGDLVVLINPAAEAAKWVRLQRAVLSRIAFFEQDGPIEEIAKGHRFFPDDQKPVLISMTAARYWPPGGIRNEDCLAAHASRLLYNRLRDSVRAEARGLLYDVPTSVLFPAFRLDFRPLADVIEGWAHQLPRKQAEKVKPCTERPQSGPLGDLAIGVADRLRYFPFMNTDLEQTRTIGHLDPPRPAYGHLLQSGASEQPFGTTHEMGGLRKRDAETLIPFHTIGDSSEAACPRADGWLLAARRLVPPFGTLWDTAWLRHDTTRKGQLETLSRLGLDRIHPPAAHIIHGLVNAGRKPITHGNDPFWNIRAYDNILAKHNGYVLSSLICTTQQFVMDDIVAVPPTLLAALERPSQAQRQQRHEGRGPSGQEDEGADARQHQQGRRDERDGASRPASLQRLEKDVDGGGDHAGRDGAKPHLQRAGRARAADPLPDARHAVDEEGRRAEDGQRRDERPPRPRDLPADQRDEQRPRPGRHAGDREGVEEGGLAHPVAQLDRLIVDVGDDGLAAAHRHQRERHEDGDETPEVGRAVVAHERRPSRR